MLTELCPDCGHPMNKHGWNGCTLEPTKDHLCHCSIRPSYIMYVEAATRQADALERIAASLEKCSGLLIDTTRIVPDGSLGFTTIEVRE
jgi:hypothetical protein